MQPVLLVQGGAGDIPEDEVECYRLGVRRAALEGWKFLERKGALDAVVAAVRVMEDDPTFNAGRGSYPTVDGFVEMDAMVMTGDLHIGAVAAVRQIRHPVLLAMEVLQKTDHCLLAGRGAESFARLIGMEFCDNSDLIVPEKLKRRGYNISDTVGAVALDASGNLSAATSTGGCLRKMTGRVGDTPLVGCGTYARNGMGASSTTGHGESIMKMLLAFRACDLLERCGSAKKAAEQAIHEMKQITGQNGGIILVSAEGDTGFAHTSKSMPTAVVIDGEIEIFGL